MFYRYHIVVPYRIILCLSRSIRSLYNSDDEILDNNTADLGLVHSHSHHYYYYYESLGLSTTANKNKNKNNSCSRSSGDIKISTKSAEIE